MKLTLYAKLKLQKKNFSRYERKLKSFESTNESRGKKDGIEA